MTERNTKQEANEVPFHGTSDRTQSLKLFNLLSLFIYPPQRTLKASPGCWSDRKENHNTSVVASDQ